MYSYYKTGKKKLNCNNLDFWQIEIDLHLIYVIFTQIIRKYYTIVKPLEIFKFQYTVDLHNLKSIN